MRELTVRNVEGRLEWLLPRNGGWVGVGRNTTTWFGAGLDIERQAPTTCSGQPAVSPDGALLALPGSGVVQVLRDDGDLEISLPLRPAPDRSTFGVAFSADGAHLLVTSPGPESATAEAAAYSRADAWRVVDKVAFGTDVDVSLFVRPHPVEPSYLTQVGAGQDGQWAWCIRAEADRLTATEITLLRDYGAYDLSVDGSAVLAVPWGEEPNVTWHAFPSGALLHSLPPSALTGVDDENDDHNAIHSIHGLGRWTTLVVTDGGRIRLLDCTPGRGSPALLAETALDPGIWPSSVSGVVGTRLLLADSGGKLHLWELGPGSPAPVDI